MTKPGRLFRTHKGEYLAWQRRHLSLLGSVYPDVNAADLPEYFAAVASKPGNLWMQDGIRNLDMDNGRITVFDGFRRTVGNNPGEVKRNIYMLGDSRMYGVGAEDADTLPSRLQEIINRNGISANVLNHGVRANALVNVYRQIKTLHLRPADVVVLFLTTRANFRKKSGYAALAGLIFNYCHEKRINLVVARWPDIRRIKNPSRLERVFQRLTYGDKKYVFIPDADSLDSYGGNCGNLKIFDTTAVFNRPHAYGEIFWDHHHLGPAAYRVIAGALFKHLEEIFREPAGGAGISRQVPLSEADEVRIERELMHFEIRCKRNYLRQQEDNINNALQYYSRYIPKFRIGENEKIGCIVMNCNPFSLGHKYLVERALEKVDYLYIFIVEEDKSLFPFEHRFYMVQKHFKGNRRVKVLPSGKLVISSLTFPDYFDKERPTESEADLVLDVFIFYSVIAKIFNITSRFVGTEPFCDTTRQYNKSLKEILPRHGIEFHEIERVRADGLPISATRIRECMQKNDIEGLRALVPQTTFEIIRELYVKQA